MSVRGRVRRSATEWLRGYTYDPRTHNYHKIGVKGFVKRADILAKLDKSLTQREETILRHVQELADGKLKGNTYLALEKRMLKQQALQQAALAAGGWDRLTPSDRGRVGQMLGVQYKSQGKVAYGLADKTVTLPQALSRTHMALGNVRRVGLEIENAHRPPSKGGMVWIAMRTLGQAEHCDDCVRMHDAGWGLADDVPVPGDDSVCDGHCHCEREVKEIPESELDNWIGTRN